MSETGYDGLSVADKVAATVAVNEMPDREVPSKRQEPKDGVTAIEFMRRAVAFRLKLTRIGSRRAVDADLIETGDAEKALVKVTKEILDSKELNDIRNHDIETRAAIRRKALPSLLGSGWYLIAAGSVDTIDAYVEERASERAVLIEALCEALPRLKDRSKARLGHLWVEEQFPTPNVIREKCGVATKYMTFDTPASTVGISKAILAREVQKAQKEAEAAKDSAIALLRAEMEEAVGALVKAFQPNVKGVKPGLRAPTLARVNEAFDTFLTSRNIAGDEALAGLVAQAKALVAGKDTKAINREEGIGAAFESIKANVSKLVEEGPSRVIDFEE